MNVINNNRGEGRNQQSPKYGKPCEKNDQVSSATIFRGKEGNIESPNNHTDWFPRSQAQLDNQEDYEC